MRHRTSLVAPARPGRRTVVLGAVASLCGCAVRLEDDAPPIPLIPTREPVPAEEALLWLLADCRRLSAAGPAGAGSGTTPGTETGTPRPDVYDEQVSVLRSALHRAGVPIETLDETIADATTPSTGTGTATPSAPEAGAATAPSTTTPAAPSTPAGATPQPSAALDRIEDVRRCGPGMFPIVMSLLSQRWAAVVLAGDPLPEPMVEDRSARIWRFPALARGFALLSQPGVYGLEVVSAQLSGDARAAALVALDTVRRLGREQDIRAGGSTPPPEIGYALPTPVDSEESAAALASLVLGTLTEGYGGLLPTITGSAQQDTARDVVTWIGSVVALGADWGLAPQPFPGIRAEA
jgi:hypothetical protein